MAANKGILYCRSVAGRLSRFSVNEIPITFPPLARLILFVPMASPCGFRRDQLPALPAVVVFTVLLIVTVTLELGAAVPLICGTAVKALLWVMLVRARPVLSWSTGVAVNWVEVEDKLLNSLMAFNSTCGPLAWK